MPTRFRLRQQLAVRTQRVSLASATVIFGRPVDQSSGAALETRRL
jgi:hypothetical protein